MYIVYDVYVWVSRVVTLELTEIHLPDVRKG